MVIKATKPASCNPMNYKIYITWNTETVSAALSLGNWNLHSNISFLKYSSDHIKYTDIVWHISTILSHDPFKLHSPNEIAADIVLCGSYDIIKYACWQLKVCSPANFHPNHDFTKNKRLNQEAPIFLHTWKFPRSAIFFPNPQRPWPSFSGSKIRMEYIG